MLVLTRKLGESVVIGDKIRVTIVDIHGKQIRLGIDAPPEISVHRGEIYEKIAEENRRAATAEARALQDLVQAWRSKDSLWEKLDKNYRMLDVSR